MALEYDTPKKDYSSEAYIARIIYDIPTSENQGNASGLGPNSAGKNVVTAYLPENFQMAFQSSFDQPFAQGLIQNQAVNLAARAFAGVSLTTQSMTIQVWQGTSPVDFSLTFIFVANDDPIKDVVWPIATLTKLALPGRAQGFGGVLIPPGPRADLSKAYDQIVSAVSEFSPQDLLQGVVAATAGTIAGPFGIVGASKAGLVNFQNLAQKSQSALNKLGEAISAPIKQPLNNIALRIGRFMYFRSVVIESVSQVYDTAFDSNGQPIKASVDVSFKTFVIPTKQDVNEIFPALGGGGE